MANCAQCESNVNLTLAEDLLILGQKCLSSSLSRQSASLAALTGSATAAPTASSSANHSASGVSSASGLPYSCITACESYDLYVTCVSTDFSCICSNMLAYGPVCSRCRLSTSDSAGASLISAFVSNCSFLSSLTYPSYVPPTSTSSSGGAQPATTASAPITIIQTGSATSTSKSGANAQCLDLSGVSVIWSIVACGFISSTILVFFM